MATHRSAREGNDPGFIFINSSSPQQGCNKIMSSVPRDTLVTDTRDSNIRFVKPDLIQPFYSNFIPKDRNKYPTSTEFES